MLRRFSILLGLVWCVATYASVNTPAPEQSGSLLLTGATVHLVSGPKIDTGWIMIDEGKIQALGGMDEPAPEADQTMDLTGKHIYPGLIAANSSLGLVEVSAVRATNDQAEAGLINPNTKAQVAVNPDSELFPVARANGIMYALSVPLGGLITGQSALLQLDGWTWEEMTVASPVAIHVRWPNMRYGTGEFNSDIENEEEFEKQLKQTLLTLEDTFQKAKAYDELRDAGNSDIDSRWEAMRGLFSGDMKVFGHTNDIRQINHALYLSEKIGFELTIVGGRDAWRVAETLKNREVAVIVSPIHALPLRRWEAYNAQFANPAKLFEAGVQFCIAVAEGGFAASNQRNLPYQAATAAAHGLPKNEAIKAITLYPAQILGVADRIGSIEVGKDATVIVTTGDPLEITSQVEMAYIQGREIDLSSRHTRLYEKYQEKYRQLESPLPTEEETETQ